MSWDALQHEVLAELGLRVWLPHVPGSEQPPVDPKVLASLARAIGVAPEALAGAGLALPGVERLRDPAVKRALWPQLRALRRRR